MMTSKAANYTVSPLLQKLFVGLGVLGYALQVAFIVSAFFSVHGPTLRFSQFTYIVIESVLLPLILFAIAYVTSPAAPRLWRIFESMFLAFMGLLIQIVVMQLLQVIVEEIVVQLVTPGNYLLAYQAVITVISLLIYGLFMRRYRRVKSTPHKLSPAIQRTFSILAYSALALLVAVMTYRIIRQLPSNPNLSAHLMNIVNLVIVPGIFLGAAYATSSRKLTPVLRRFDAVFLAAGIGMILFTIIQALSRYAGPFIVGIHGNWQTYEFASVGVAIVIYGLLIFWIRRKS